MPKREVIRRIDLTRPPGTGVSAAGAPSGNLPDIFLHQDGSRLLYGHQDVAAGIRVDGVDISDHPRGGWGHCAMEIPSNRRFLRLPYPLPSPLIPADWSVILDLQNDPQASVTSEPAAGLPEECRQIVFSLQAAATHYLRWRTADQYVPRLARLESGRSYKFSCWLKAGNPPIASLKVILSLWAHDTRRQFYEIASQTWTSFSTSWAQYSFDFDVTDEQLSTLGEFLDITLEITGPGEIAFALPLVSWKPSLFHRWIEWVNDFASLITGIFAGRLDGPHVGIFRRQEPLRYLFQGTNLHNVPYFNMGALDAEEMGEWLRLGYEGYPGIELREVEGYPVKQLIVDVECLSRRLGPDDLDLKAMACSFAVCQAESLDDLFLDPGVLVQTSDGLYLSLGEGNYQFIIGQNRIAQHPHLDELSGGRLDHGLAMNPGSLLDDDHPQYTLRSTWGAKGDLVTSNGTELIRLPAGEDGQVLVADSSAPGGLTWTGSVGAIEAGYYEPISSGLPNPEVIFDPFTGDILMTRVE
jgi:hypothetical protein